MEITNETIGRFAYLKISNNGLPIAEDIGEKLLKESVESSSGLGYGLYHSRRNMLCFGGDLDFTSTPDRTEFVLKLPLAHEDTFL